MVRDYCASFVRVLFGIIFTETGVVIMPFLPGDRCCSPPAPSAFRSDGGRPRR